MTTTEISSLFNLSGERLRQLAAGGHFPKPERGQWDLKGVSAGLVAYLQERLSAKKDSPEFIAARESKMKSEAAMAALVLAEKEKKVVSLASVELVWSARKTGIRHVITNSRLPRNEQDIILNNLLNIKVEDYLNATS